MSGFYDSPVLIERFLASVSAENLPQPFIVPTDLDVIGLVAHVGTAPGGADGVTINGSVFPTSQQGGALASVSAYNLWTTANVPSILGTAVNSFTTTNTTEVIQNFPYALDYPLPGPAGTVGYETAQATSQITTAPVTAPPELYIYEMGALVAPDNTYTDYNGVTLKPAYHLHAGDVLTFVIGAGGTGASVGAAANLAITLFTKKN